jgi:hypothetical protein
LQLCLRRGRVSLKPLYREFNFFVSGDAEFFP